MSHKIVAVVRLALRGQKFQDADFSALESLLRDRGNITITQLDEDDMRFLMVGESKLDYTILDQMKTALQSRRFANFVLSADEYVWTGEKYRFAQGLQDD